MNSARISRGFCGFGDERTAMRNPTPLYTPNMTKKDVKVKKLAKELGVTARALIERCRGKGLRVQNSITRIRASDVERIRLWYHPSPDKSPDAPTTAAEAEKASTQNDLLG